MRLPRPFFKLPLTVDLERLRVEVAALAPHAWAPHPNRIEGNTSVRLISSQGEENDDVHGPMAPTAHLRQMPYVRQLLADFGVVWSRSRLMQLAPHAQVPAHADVNFHWFNRVRVHIPVITNPQVLFHCGDDVVHMAAGEVWLFDNWRMHRVENQSAEHRIHLVADTTGSASFWRFVAESLRAGAQVRQHLFDASRDAEVRTERVPPEPVLHPAEIEMVVQDVRRELAPKVDDEKGRAHAANFGHMLGEFAQDWRQVHSLHGQDPAGWPSFLSLRDGLRKVCATQARSLIARTNGIDMLTIVEGRLLRHVLHLPVSQDPASAGSREP